MSPQPPTRPRSGVSHLGTVPGDPAALARAPWTIRAADVELTVRGARASDLSAVAALHHRCTPTSLLYRFGRGGRTPSVTALQHMLTRPLTVVVCTGEGRVVAWAAADPHLDRPRPVLRPAAVVVPESRAEIGVLVEDGWQDLGIGRALVRHLAAAAAMVGRRELVMPACTATPVSSRLLGELGTVRRVEVEAQPHLRVYLGPSAPLGLGALQRLGAPPARAARTG